VGSDRPIETDVRVLAASNRHPHDAVAAGKLRKDLLYRLQVFPLHVPPLRERSEDIELLANHFLAQLNKRSSTTKTLTPAAVDRLKRYHWPGNVRELSNAIHRAFIMADGEWITQVGLSQEPTLAADFSGRSFQVGVGDRIDAVEKRLILATVQHTHTKEAAAEILGISVKTLYNRLRAYESGADLPRSGAATLDSPKPSPPAGGASPTPDADPRTSAT
jgi:DNA-binding NtrC family response regulator